LSNQPPAVPAIRRFNFPLPVALNARVRAVDQSTGLTFTHFQSSVTILDVINDPDPGVGLLYTIFLIKGSVDLGREFYSTGLSAASAGRMSVGPVAVRGPCDIAFECTQTLGAFAAYNFAVKFSNL
jgi:hypothetical protein